MAIPTPLPCRFDARYGPVAVQIQRTETGLSVVVETLRLKILSVNTDKYLQDLIALYGNATVNQFVGDGSTKSAAAVQAKVHRWLKRWAEHNPLAGYVVIKKDTGEFVGQIALKPIKHTPRQEITSSQGIIELRYLSCEHHWRRGYGGEATHAVLHHLVPNLIQQGFTVEGSPIKQIIATADPKNTASWRILYIFMHYTDTKPAHGSRRFWYHCHYPP